MNKRNNIEQAKNLFNQGKIQAAAQIFNEVVKDSADEIDAWDVFHMVKCARKGGVIFDLDQQVVRFTELEPLNVIYSWLLYDRHVRSFDKYQVHTHENGIQQITERVAQKNFNDEGADDIPCPYTMGVFKLLKAFRKPNLNINKVEKWISKIDPDKLSKKENVFTDISGKERRLASPYEDYYSILSGLRLKQERLKECIELCDFGLENISTFHYDNEIWFKRRKALSMIKLGNEDKGFELLVSISKKRKGDKWFLYHEIAEVYFENEDYSNSLEYCKKGIEAFGDEAFKVKLLILTARCLFKLERTEDAEILANYLVGISIVHELKEKQDLQRVISYFKIDKDTIKNPKKYLGDYRRKVDVLFKIERNRIKKKEKKPVKYPSKEFKVKLGDEIRGRIKTIHGNGLSGHVGVGKESYFFSVRDVKVDQDKLDRGVNVILALKNAKDRDGNPDKHAVILKII